MDEYQISSLHQSFFVEKFFLFSCFLRQYLHIRTVIMFKGQLNEGGEALTKWFIQST